MHIFLNNRLALPLKCSVYRSFELLGVHFLSILTFLFPATLIAGETVGKIEFVPIPPGWFNAGYPRVSPGGNVTGVIYRPETNDALAFSWKSGETSVRTYAVPDCSKRESLIPQGMSEDGDILAVRDCKNRIAIFYRGQFAFHLPFGSGSGLSSNGRFIVAGQGDPMHPTGYGLLELMRNMDTGKIETVDVDPFSATNDKMGCGEVSADGLAAVCRLGLFGKGLVLWGALGRKWIPVPGTINERFYWFTAISYNLNFAVGIKRGCYCFSVFSRLGDPIDIGNFKYSTYFYSLSHDGRFAVGTTAERPIVWQYGSGWKYLSDFVINDLGLKLDNYDLTSWAQANADGSKIAALVRAKNSAYFKTILISVE